MPTNYVFIDYENVQPKNLDILKQHSFKIFVFVGANQTKIPFDLAKTLQNFGEDAKYIKISGTGKNALDFHIAFYIGLFSTLDPEGYFHIISKDMGFDQLVTHLRSRKIRVNREKDLAEIPMLRISSATNNDEKISSIIKNLAGRGQARPRKVKTLANTINSLLSPKLEEKEMNDLINELKKRKYIVIKDANVSYKLPKQL